ncbi:MAG: Cytochrome bd-type quinol oxidase subunit 2-like protein [Blastococcus sp.]|nr:Cytochrome bd-type quinol oxidase subunit 2-like protein [Blastococcus sp.]
MTLLQVLPMVFVLIELSLYTLLGGADLGTGVWQLLAGRGPRAARIRTYVYEAIGPIWEANHVWLIAVLTIMWTCYPGAFGDIASTLVVPLFIAGIGIVLRGTTYAMHGATRGPEDHREITTLFGLSSVLTPFALGAAVGAIASGRVPVGDQPGGYLTWLNPTSVLVGVLAVLVGAFLAAVQLTASADRQADWEMSRAFRRRALVSGLLAGAVALAGPFVARHDAPDLYTGLLHGDGRAAVAVSALAGLVALGLVLRRRAALARYAAALAIAALVAGWALAQSPQLLPGLTVAHAAAPRSALIGTTVAVIAGFVVVAPCLGLLFWLVLHGRFERVVQSWPAAGTVHRASEATRRRRAGASALTFVLGAGAVVFGTTLWPQVVGVLLLLAALVGGFAAVGPGELADEDTLDGALTADIGAGRKLRMS